MSSPSIPTRLIVCVDGTQYQHTPSKISGTQTNIHRLYEGVQPGRSFCKFSGETFNQVTRYVSGIGSADATISTDRLQASVLGQGHIKQIQDVYESCCQLTGSKDEVWLFGFSRGAFVVRAVAGLLHQLGAANSAGQPEFSKDFKKLLKESERRSGLSSGLGLSPVSSISSASVRSAPRIRFVGVFDTINPTSDNKLFDTSFNGSIQHMRHALALHEDRKALGADAIYPEEFYRTALRESKRSFVQAWFTGNHADMGGSSKKAGLGLYPLQWMMLEASACRLALVAGGNPKTLATNPLSVVLPGGIDGKTDVGQWSCTTANGIKVTMQDLRRVHESSHAGEDLSVKLVTRHSSIRQKKSREPFTNTGLLQGYCDWSPQGTIIHPSVYMLLDEHVNVSMETKELKLQRYTEDWREKMLGSLNGVVNTGFWLDEDDDDGVDIGAIRVLVCGNTGVGKSTLINKTFGVDVTQSSNRIRGIHDVKQEITFEERPDLVVHDSGGFEAGADDEFQAVQEFLKDKSAAVDVKDRLHIIWFCIDINSPRTLQTATEKLFQAVSMYASDVPIVVVATKKDDFLDLQFSAHRKALKREGKRFDEEACEEYAEERLRERIDIIRAEMESVPGGRLDACLGVSQDDADSIANLSKVTSQCFDTDKVRLLYIRAQVSRIDLKVEMAVAETVKRYRQLIREATGSAFAPMGSTITRKVSTVQVTRKIINCFGLPTVSAETALEALKTIVWNMLGTNVTFALAECFHLVGILGSAAVSGAPIYLLTGSINAAYLVPATCRLFLIMACDLTLVLARSFKEVTFRARGQPNDRDVSAAARNYRVRGYSQHVHKDVKALVPRRNAIRSFQADRVQQGVERIFDTYKDKLMEDVDLPLNVGGLKIGSKSIDDDISTLASSEADSSIANDIRDGKAAMAELDMPSKAVEMDASHSVVELPAEQKAVELPTVDNMAELPDPSTLQQRHELSG